MKRTGLLFTLLLWGTAASAFTINPFVDGADMAGIEVTVTFDDGNTETGIWALTGMDSGQASGTGWSLSQIGDTFGSTDLNNPLGFWTLSNNDAATITGLKVDSAATDIIFDVILANSDSSFPLGYDEGTAGSRQGRPFTVFPPNLLGIDSDLNNPTGNNTDDVDYLNLISSPDLFGAFEVSLGDGLASGENLRFWIDTDQIPEPPLYGLLALGLAGFFVRNRKEAAAS